MMDYCWPSIPDLCEALRPPPFPHQSSDDIYAELYNFVTSNATLNESINDFNCMCNETLLPPLPPDIGTSTNREASTSTTASAPTSTNTDVTTQSMLGNTTSIVREVTTVLTEDTASGSVTLIIVIISLIIIAVAVGTFGYIWMKKHRKKTSYNVESDENGALDIQTYKEKNYLHNQAENNKQWPNSSPRESKDDKISTANKVENGAQNKVITNGGDKIQEDIFDTRKSTVSDVVSETAFINENFVSEREEENPGSPGVKSVKSDTPLIPGDAPDGTQLPNQTVPCDDKSDHMTKVPLYGSVTNGTNNTYLPQIKNTALPPLSTQEQVNLRSPKKKKRGLGKKIMSEECKTRNGLAEDIADIRYST